MKTSQIVAAFVGQSVLMVGLIVGGFAYLERSRPPATPVIPSAYDAGRTQAVYEALATGDAWDQWAAAIGNGSTVQDATAARQKSLQDAREAAFRRTVAPTMAGVLKEGGEPAGPEERAAIVKFGRDMASGNRKAVGK